MIAAVCCGSQGLTILDGQRLAAGDFGVGGEGNRVAVDLSLVPLKNYAAPSAVAFARLV